MPSLHNTTIRPKPVIGSQSLSSRAYSRGISGSKVARELEIPQVATAPLGMTNRASRRQRRRNWIPSRPPPRQAQPAFGADDHDQDQQQRVNHEPVVGHPAGGVFETRWQPAGHPALGALEHGLK